MNALIRGQKNLFGLNNFGSTRFHKYGDKTSFRAYKTRKYKINDDNNLRNSIGNIRYQNLDIPHPSVTLPITYSCLSNYCHQKHNFLTSNNDCFSYNRRHFTVGRILYEQPSSKVEVTVQKMKDKQKEEALKKETQQSLALDTKVPDTQKPVVIKKSLKQKIWDEILHYYHGFRLLFIDINICRKLLWRVLMGKKLTRRESRLLVRTTSDLFRLLPFSIFIIVPFMELLLPVFIKFFPGMLPSTFQTAKEREDKLKQSLQVKLEVAKFLQKTLDEMAVQHKDHKSQEAKDFSEFFRRIKDPNHYVSNDEIIKFAKVFEDELTLDSLSRDQITALCRILEISTLGTNNFLRFQIKMKLRNLAADDRLIQREGVDSLNLSELQQACKSRGMRAYGLSAEKLRYQLQEWIDLSLNEKVPSTLILLSRALMVPDNTPTTDKLKATISSLPDAVATQTKAAIGEREGKIDNKTKIEIIKEEERKIKEELEEEREVEKEALREKAEVLVDKARTLGVDKILEASQIKDETFSSKDVEALGEALETISKDKKKLLVEKEAIKELKEEIEEYKEDVEELREITTKDIQQQVRETRGAKILYKKVNSMINNLDKVLTDLEKEEKKLKQDLEQTAEKEVDVYEKKKDQLVRIDEIVGAIKQLQNISDESRLTTIEKVLSKIDADQDGHIKVDDVLKVIETLGKDNVKLSEKQLEEVIDLLDKEEILDAEDKIEKALAKSLKESKQQTSEQLQDTAPVLTDKAEELDDKHILTKTKEKEKDSLKNNIIVSSATAEEAVTKQQDKILPKTQTDMPPPLPPIPPTSKTNSKDKMI